MSQTLSSNTHSRYLRLLVKGDYYTFRSLHATHTRTAEPLAHPWKAFPYNDVFTSIKEGGAFNRLTVLLLTSSLCPCSHGFLDIHTSTRPLNLGECRAHTLPSYNQSFKSLYRSYRRLVCSMSSKSFYFAMTAEGLVGSASVLFSYSCKAPLISTRVPICYKNTNGRHAVCKYTFIPFSHHCRGSVALSYRLRQTHRCS